MIRRLFICLCAFFIASSCAFAAADVKPTILDPVANKRVAEIASQLRCLVCQNQSIADSNGAGRGFEKPGSKANRCR